MLKATSGLLVKSALAGSLGGLMFGFDTAVIAGATRSLTSSFQLTPETLGVTVSSALWGTVVSAMVAGVPGEKFGARECLKATAIMYMVSAIGCAFAPNWYALLFFRLIGGLGIGASSVLGPVYIAELAPSALRGRLVGLFQINIVVGILVAYFSNYLIGLLNLGEMEWRAQLGVSGIPALFFLVMLFGIPRSPRWLVANGKVEEARDILTRLTPLTAEKEMMQITESLHLESEHKNERLFQKKYSIPIALALCVGIFNQLTGINAILYYLNDIFAQAGFNKVSSDFQAVMVGCANLVFTLVGMSMIDKYGRKPLLIAGAIGTALCLMLVGFVFQTNSHKDMLVYILVAFIAFFAFSQGTVIWVYLSEIFPTRVRARGQGLGCSAHWIMNALISFLFPIMAKTSTSAPFFFFGAMMIVQCFIVIKYFPETRGVSLEDLQKKLAPDSV